MEIEDVPVNKLIENLAEKFEQMPEFKPPVWEPYVKTGVSRERPPTQENWWFIRAASILRKTYNEPGIGVSRLRKVYGGRKNRGHKPEHTFRASGAIIRRIVKQLETAGFLQPKKNEKGRVVKRLITQKGIEFLKQAASETAR